MSLKHELQSIISGNGSVRNGKIIQTITDYLRGKKKAVSGIEKAKLIKEQETQVLIEYIGLKIFGIKILKIPSILEKEPSKRFTNFPTRNLF